MTGEADSDAFVKTDDREVCWLGVEQSERMLLSRRRDAGANAGACSVSSSTQWRVSVCSVKKARTMHNVCLSKFGGFSTSEWQAFRQNEK